MNKNMGKATYRFVYYHDATSLDEIRFDSIKASKKKTPNKREYTGKADFVALKDDKLKVYAETSGSPFRKWDLYVEYENLVTRELKEYPIEEVIPHNGYRIVNDFYELKKKPKT
ncbi:MAG: hypothetical protein ACK514_02975 [Bacteroidota bacterium]|jgi:hypothetical protein|nr:hypothetical protein [Cytophagales bacterium]MCA6430466.1 hypothetical protein [Cytophagales bacterium]MCE2956735.1 hypothetical protein [Flammeovirgaceae bacterium]MCZ8069653.1 hypothetical protein [Cytophagales bacterium]